MLVLACGLGSCSGSDVGTGTSGVDHRPAVAVAFYPLEFLVSSIDGPGVRLERLTKPGVEPHDLELAPSTVAALHDADLVVYLAGLQPAVDEAVADLDPSRVVDVSRFANLRRYDASGAPGTGTTAYDPHFWLDPRRMRDVAKALAPRLERIDHARSSEIAAGLRRLDGQLDSLDATMTSGLASCRDRNLVTSHSAFAYLADRYGFVQRGIAGLSPDAEPTPGQLAEVTAFIRANHVSTVYFETLTDPGVARTVASEAGVTASVLDPVEGLTSRSAGNDYLSVMATNLSRLRSGQSCS